MWPDIESLEALWRAWLVTAVLLGQLALVDVCIRTAAAVDPCGPAIRRIEMGPDGEALIFTEPAPAAPSRRNPTRQAGG